MSREDYTSWIQASPVTLAEKRLQHYPIIQTTALLRNCTGSPTESLGCMDNGRFDLVQPPPTDLRRRAERLSLIPTPAKTPGLDQNPILAAKRDVAGGVKNVNEPTRDGKLPGHEQAG